MGMNQPGPPTFPDGIDVVQETVLSGGKAYPVELPQRYYDWSFMMAHFPASAARVRAVLPDGLEAVEIVPGTAVVSLAAYEYRVAATLQPYNEVAVLMPVRYRPKRKVFLLPLLCPEEYEVGFWIHHLPVTTEEANAVGREVWGMPKVVAKITFKDVGWTRHCELEQDGQRVLTFSAPVAETQVESRDFYAFSVRNGQLLESLIETRAGYHAWQIPGQASFSLGTHPVSDAIREFEMKNLAIAGVFADAARSRLYRGAPPT